jgi:hypothetical protein
MYFRVAYRMNRCSGLCLLILRLILEGPEVCLMLVSWHHGAYFSAESFASSYVCPFLTQQKQTDKNPVYTINFSSGGCGLEAGVDCLDSATATCIVYDAANALAYHSWKDKCIFWGRQELISSRIIYSFLMMPLDVSLIVGLSSNITITMLITYATV